MNKLVKTILYILNFLILGIATYWFKKDQSPEPLIIIISQILALMTLIFESKIANIAVSKISNSTVDVDVNQNDNSNIKVANIKEDSKIKISKR